MSTMWYSTQVWRHFSVFTNGFTSHRWFITLQIKKRYSLSEMNTVLFVGKHTRKLVKFHCNLLAKMENIFFVGELKIDRKRPLQRLKGKLVFASKSDSNYSFWQQTLAGIVISFKKYINMVQCNSNFWKKLKKVKDSLWDNQAILDSKFNYSCFF